MRIAKMANLYQYCTSSECNRWFAKAWIRTNSDQDPLTRTIFFTSKFYKLGCIYND